MFASPESLPLSRSLHHTTQSFPAYESPHGDVRPAWRLIVVGLLLVAVASVSLRRVCRPDVPGTSEPRFGVRHEQRGTQWYHCEPWIRRVLAD